MRFMRGLVVGTILTTGAMMICSEGVDINKKKMMKKGKQFAKKMGIYL